MPSVAGDQIESVLRLLAPVDAAIVRLRYVEGATASEAADQLGISVSAAEQRASRALQRLKAAVATNDDLFTELRLGHPRHY